MLTIFKNSGTGISTLNGTDRWNSRLVRPLTGLTALLAVLPLLATAQESTEFRASAQIEQNSNVFYLPNASFLSTPYVGKALGSMVQVYTGEIAPKYQWEDQSLTARFLGRDLKYSEFSDLNHTEYLAQIGLGWQLTPRFHGNLEAARERRLVRYEEVLTSTLLVEKETRAKGDFTFDLTSQWRIDGLLKTRQDDSPRPQASDLRVHENSAQVGFKFSQNGDIYTGLSGEYVQGNFQGLGGLLTNPTIGVVDFHRSTIQAVVERTQRDNDILKAALGYTSNYLNNGLSTFNVLSGEAGYKRSLTGKTVLDIVLSRGVSAYLSSAGVAVDTKARAGVSWQATSKIDVSAGLGYTRSTIPGWNLVTSGVSVVGASLSDRQDKIKQEYLEVVYNPLRPVSLRPYVRHEARDSNIATFQYTDTIYGAQFTITF